MPEGVRTTVIGLLYELGMARAGLDLPTRRACAAQLRGIEISPAERAQAQVLVEACEGARLGEPLGSWVDRHAQWGARVPAGGMGR